MKTSPLRTSTAAFAAAALMLVGCGNDDDVAESVTESVVTEVTESVATAGASSGVTVTRAWARSSPMNAKNAAAYMVLASNDGDRLVGASVDPAVAAKVELHETVTAAAAGSVGDAMSADESASVPADSAMDAPAAMTMRPVEGIDVPAGDTATLEPGGFHVMLLDLASPLQVGQILKLTLRFATSGEQVIEVPVREEAP